LAAAIFMSEANLSIAQAISSVAGFDLDLDMETGPDQGASFGSGIVLTEPPFNLKPKDTKCFAKLGGLAELSERSFSEF
jgi:hypothetical protein